MNEKEPRPFLGPDKGGDFGNDQEIAKQEGHSEFEAEKYRFHNPREVISKWLSDEERKKGDNDVLYRDLNHHLRNDVISSGDVANTVAIILGSEDSLVQRLHTTTRELRSAIDPLLNPDISSFDEVEKVVQTADQHSYEWEKLMREIIAQHPDQSLPERLSEVGHLRTIDLLKASLDGFEEDKKLSLEKVLKSNLAGVVPSIDQAEDIDKLSTKERQILVVLAGDRDASESFGPSDRRAIEEFVTECRAKGINFQEYLNAQGFKIDVNVPDDLAVSERFSRIFLKNPTKSWLIDAIKASEDRGEGQKFHGSLKIELQKEDSGYVLLTSIAVTNDEAARLSALEKEELPLPADIASYKYHHMSTYLQRLVFDRYQRTIFKNDFELKDDPAGGGKVVTRRFPIVSVGSLIEAENK